MKHFLYVPFVGLGLYKGWRGNRWFKNRIKIFKQFVVPSLLAQTNRDFILWVSFTHREKGKVNELSEFLDSVGLKHIFTYSGVCFWDDKYPYKEAWERLVVALHNSIGELSDVIGETDEVLMTIQPSDDCYYMGAVDEIQREIKDVGAVGYKNGYIANYKTLEVSEYNPNTNPPFYTIKFPREVFTDPLKHMAYTALKHPVEGYNAGTPLPSHEWVKDCLIYKQIDRRGFLVGCHGENISTYYDHPFKGDKVENIFEYFGLKGVSKLEIKDTLGKKILRRIPHHKRKRLRYLLGECVYNKFLNVLRR